MIYECHITCQLADGPKVTALSRDMLGWRTSQIAGDIVLGKETYLYLTRHHPDLLELHAGMVTVADTLRMHGIEVVRQKIELIVFDTKLYPKES